jgi:hypothetical protein
MSSSAAQAGHCIKWSVLRKGAVRKRMQLEGKVMGKAAWNKRDKTSGEFIAVKKSAKNSKACGARKALEKRTVPGRGASGTVFESPPAPKGAATGSINLDSLNGGSFHNFLAEPADTSIRGRDDPRLLRCERPVNRALGSGHRLGFDGRLAREHHSGNRSGPFPETALDTLNNGIFDVPIFHHQPSF